MVVAVALGRGDALPALELVGTADGDTEGRGVADPVLDRLAAPVWL